MTLAREERRSISALQDVDVLSIGVVKKIPNTNSGGISTKAPLTFLPGNFRAGVAQNFDVDTKTHE